MHDLVIKGGKIVDGTGAPGYAGDVAIAGGRIVEVGKVNGVSREVIDADGALVTPGFVDPHTHYDGQFTWDDTLEPSFSHGVTTVVGGNCGVGFAPVRPAGRDVLIDLMDGVEEIPGPVLAEGLKWDWESFPDFLDVLDRRQYSMDIGVQLTHAPLRVYVMGDRALAHEAATAEDIEAMSGHVRAAMKAGAFGFSAARVLGHLARSGAHVPGTFAADEELTALARAMGEEGKGVFQIVPLGADGLGCTPDEYFAEHDRFKRIAAAAGRPLTYLMLQVHTAASDTWRRLVQASEAAHEEGLFLYPQIATRGFGVLLALDGAHPFETRPTYRRLAQLPLAQRLVEMRKPEVTSAILGEADDLTVKEKLASMSDANLARLYRLQEPIDYEPDVSQNFGALAAAAGKNLREFAYDYFVSGPNGGVAVWFALNYAGGDLSHVPEMLASPVTVAGLGDGGAHSRYICDASLPTFSLSFWARDRKRGPTLPVELMVKRQTSDAARLYALADRGTIAPGLRADLNVIDFDRLKLKVPSISHDLPAGGARVTQGSEGYLATMVNGVVTRRHDRDTGARPGRLLRWR
jgi:N-acyl-D-aspartate/D-glutamate deacylase